MFTAMKSLLQQLKKRRIDLNLRQKDMMLRIGVSRQQYQHLESRGNPGLGTLELIAKGLNSELILIPKEKLSEVRAVLERETSELSNKPTKGSQDKENKSLSDNPWQDLIEDDQ
jgi:transcriptional regulator with XRE-family HTH domain